MSNWTTAFRSLKMYLLMNRSSVDSVYRYPADGRGLLPQDNTYLPIHRRVGARYTYIAEKYFLDICDRNTSTGHVMNNLTAKQR